ncbi:CoA ester lyase, partial [bacterium]
MRACRVHEEAHSGSMMRSYLFVPADSERKLAKGSESGADALILDLEDSVAEARRPLARDSARAYIEAARGGPQLYVRINALASGAALDDLAVVMRARPHGIMLPKCVPNDVRTLDAYLSAFEAAGGHPAGATQIVAIATETPASLFALHDYRGASARLEALTWGAEDLAAALGSENRLADGTYGDVFRLARSLCVVAAGAAEVAAIDTVFTDFKDERGL